jgi:hypothetical protein
VHRGGAQKAGGQRGAVHDRVPLLPKPRLVNLALQQSVMRVEQNTSSVQLPIRKLPKIAKNNKKLPKIAKTKNNQINAPRLKLSLEPSSVQ